MCVLLSRLISTAENVAVLQEELTAMQPKLKQTQKEVADMMVKIQSDTEEAEKTKAVVADQSEQAGVKAAECKGIKVWLN